MENIYNWVDYIDRYFNNKLSYLDDDYLRMNYKMVCFYDEDNNIIHKNNWCCITSQWNEKINEYFSIVIDRISVLDNIRDSHLIFTCPICNVKIMEYHITYF